ncbi:MAG TPA: methyltransferase domain-containing protein [Candidatus Dormibacteraeota bacterium]
MTELVKTAYANLDQGGGFLAIEHMYSAAELEPLPLAAIDWALGVGNPVRHAGLQLGETVLDVGSGGGIDSILAARHVGPDGNVVGLDILPEMTARAAEHARAAGVGDRCSFVVGQMEAIPLPDASVDVVISNGVINLSPRKARVLAELFRTLRPGGRFCISDLVVETELPPEVLTNGAAWAG